MGAGNRSAIATLVERTTRLVPLVKLVKKDSASAAAAFTRRFKQLPPTLRKTLTYDQGNEMARHAELTLATGMAVYFCDPHSPWQRGTNENTNGLIRDFFPKGTDFAAISAQKLSFVQQALTERPRKTLGWKTPKNAFNQVISQAQLDALASGYRRLLFHSSATGAGSTQALTAYPNPTTGTTYLRGLAPQARLTVHDATGRLVARTLADATGSAVLRLTALPAGVYTVRADGQALRVVRTE